MPQGQRTASETREFKLMLTNINFLYLGLRVFIMCDRTYLGRFWTQFEAVRATCAHAAVVAARPGGYVT